MCASGAQFPLVLPCNPPPPKSDTEAAASQLQLLNQLQVPLSLPVACTCLNTPRRPLGRLRSPSSPVAHPSAVSFHPSLSTPGCLSTQPPARQVQQGAMRPAKKQQKSDRSRCVYLSEAAAEIFRPVWPAAACCKMAINLQESGAAACYCTCWCLVTTCRCAHRQPHVHQLGPRIERGHSVCTALL